MQYIFCFSNWYADRRYLEYHDFFKDLFIIKYQFDINWTYYSSRMMEMKMFSILNSEPLQTHPVTSTLV